MINTTAKKAAAKSAPSKAENSKPENSPKITGPSRLDQLQALITREGGASTAEMTHATGWQQHSVRGAMAGSLKKRGLAITSEKVDGVRRYRAAVPA
jgi:hypothetical protein